MLSHSNSLARSKAVDMALLAFSDIFKAERSRTFENYVGVFALNGDCFYTRWQARKEIVEILFPFLSAEHKHTHAHARTRAQARGHVGGFAVVVNVRALRYRYELTAICRSLEVGERRGGAKCGNAF